MREQYCYNARTIIFVSASCDFTVYVLKKKENAECRCAKRAIQTLTKAMFGLRVLRPRLGAKRVSAFFFAFSRKG